MLHLPLLFLILAVVFGVLCFCGIVGMLGWILRLAFIVFLALCVIAWWQGGHLRLWHSANHHVHGVELRGGTLRVH